MSNNFIGPPKRDFDQLFKLADSELITMRTNAVDAALLVAVCVNSSQGNGFFCCNPKPYQSAMNELTELPNFDAKEFLRKVVPQTGFRKGQVPKFRFVQKNWACGESLAWRCKGNDVDGIILACNWGLAQLPAWRVTEQVEPQFKQQYLKAFLGDVNMQMRELVRILVCHKSVFPLCERSALAVLHASRRSNRDYNELADRDLDLANRLRHCADPISAGYKV